MNTHIKSLCCTLETKAMLQVHYISKKEQIISDLDHKLQHTEKQAWEGKIKLNVYALIILSKVFC